MADKDPIYKSTTKDIAKRLGVIRLENKWSYDKMVEALNDNKQGLTISKANLYAMIEGQLEISIKVVKLLIEKGYDPMWLLTGTEQKKLIKGASTTITDIHLFRVELLEERSKIKVLEESIKQTDREVEYLKRMVEELQNALKVS